jgi:hypothetical protein
MTSCKRHRDYCEQDNDRSLSTLIRAYPDGANLERAMSAVDAIVLANRSTEIYALLNVYSEAIHLAEHIGAETLDPLENATDAMKRMQALFIALGLASKRLEDDSRNRIKEALFVFNAALERLRSFPCTSDDRMPRQECRRERNVPRRVSGRGKDRRAGDYRPLA